MHFVPLSLGNSDHKLRNAGPVLEILSSTGEIKGPRALKVTGNIPKLEGFYKMLEN